MAGTVKETGPSSERVAANLRRIRRDREITTAALSRRLAEIGHPIADSGITKIEKKQRRVDVDDLTALALVLGATPNRLLMPDLDRPGTRTEYMLTPVVKGSPDQLWQWAQGEKHPPIPVPGAHDWLGEGEHPDLMFALTNRPYLTGRTVRDEVAADIQPPKLEITRNLMSAVLGALAEGADASWVRRIVEITIALPETMSEEEIDKITGRHGDESQGGTDTPAETTATD